MGTLLRVVIAIVLAILITGLMDYFGLLNHALNSLIGCLAGLFFFFSDGRIARF